MELKRVLKNYHYQITLNELYVMNHKEEGWEISYNSLLYLDLIKLIPLCTGSLLADKLGISKAAVTLKVNELIKQGLVVKIQSEQDKRVFYLKISEDCEPYYKQYEKALTRSVQNIEKKYSLEERKIFSDILQDIQDEYIRVMENEE
ncbi:MarR family winged helix-turn-helix transcriptional regulator [Anaerorhabdus sp.]|uniref:MarR family winged helix-turn-helix transcriptional regulator n=1 Tax=Anaerorhabdus sp. TaxID=1872524 RepID=UPI002FC74281